MCRCCKGEQRSGPLLSRPRHPKLQLQEDCGDAVAQGPALLWPGHRLAHGVLVAKRSDNRACGLVPGDSVLQTQPGVCSLGLQSQLGLIYIRGTLSP